MIWGLGNVVSPFTTFEMCPTLAFLVFMEMRIVGVGGMETTQCR